MTSSFKDIVEKIHTILWSQTGFSPEVSIRHLNVLLMMRLLSNKLSKFGIDDKYSLINIYDIENASKTYSQFKIALAEYAKHQHLGQFFKEWNIKSSSLLQNLIEYLLQCNVGNSDDIGDLYEHLLKKRKLDAQDNGQFYTPRPVCDYIVKLVNPKDKDGTIYSFILL